VNVGSPGVAAGRGRYLTGIDKRPRQAIEIESGVGAGRLSAVVGDHVGNGRHHGGPDKAVYAFAREELEWWADELGRPLADGAFGENVTTAGLDLESLVINQRIRLGADVVLEVSLPRQPCATFQTHMGERAWMKRFSDHGRCGAYFRVVRGGTVQPGDAIQVLAAPAHGVDLLTTFAAVMGDDTAAALVVAAACLPDAYHHRLARRVAEHSASAQPQPSS
jgi:MOSC domain-containing protein YiiM